MTTYNNTNADNYMYANQMDEQWEASADSLENARINNEAGEGGDPCGEADFAGVVNSPESSSPAALPAGKKEPTEALSAADFSRTLTCCTVVCALLWVFAFLAMLGLASVANDSMQKNRETAELVSQLQVDVGNKMPTLVGKDEAETEPVLQESVLWNAIETVLFAEVEPEERKEQEALTFRKKAIAALNIVMEKGFTNVLFGVQEREEQEKQQLTLQLRKDKLVQKRLDVERKKNVCTDFCSICYGVAGFGAMAAVGWKENDSDWADAELFSSADGSSQVPYLDDIAPWWVAVTFFLGFVGLTLKFLEYILHDVLGVDTCGMYHDAELADIEAQLEGLHGGAVPNVGP